jgi:hypothetical protein
MRFTHCCSNSIVICSPLADRPHPNLLPGGRRKVGYGLILYSLREITYPFGILIGQTRVLYTFKLSLYILGNKVPGNPHQIWIQALVYLLTDVIRYTAVECFGNRTGDAGQRICVAAQRDGQADRILE